MSVFTTSISRGNVSTKMSRVTQRSPKSMVFKPWQLSRQPRTSPEERSQTKGIKQETALLTHIHSLVASTETARGGCPTHLERLKKATILHDPFLLSRPIPQQVGDLVKNPLSDAGRPWGLHEGRAGPEGLLFRAQHVCSRDCSPSRDLTEALLPFNLTARLALT